MERRSTTANPRRNRRRITILLGLAVIAAVVTLLLLEQVAVLYVVSTLGIAALLMVVAFADLGDAHRPASDPPPLDDSAALADGTATASTTFGSTTPRTVKGRRNR